MAQPIYWAIALLGDGPRPVNLFSASRHGHLA